jgi:hydrogenase maturation protease
MSTGERTGGRPTVVLGLGNPLMTDDGLGVAAVTRLREEWLVSEGVELVDGGTWGMNLLPTIEDAGRLVLVDAIDRGMPPGTTVVLERHEIPRAFALKVSPHQVDVREVLALAELRGTLPDETVAIGLQPDVVALGLELSPTLEERLDHLLDLVALQLAAWGHSCEPLARR